MVLEEKNRATQPRRQAGMHHRCPPRVAMESGFETNRTSCNNPHNCYDSEAAGEEQKVVSLGALHVLNVPGSLSDTHFEEAVTPARTKPLSESIVVF